MPVNSTTRIETLVSVVAEGSYAFSPQDTLAVVTEIPTGGTVVELPSNPSGGDAYEVADGDGSCSSGAPLTLTVAAGQTIQGGSTLALSSPFAWARATFSEPLRAWIAFVAGQAATTTVALMPLAFTTLYVDPANASGHASNSNPGTSPSAPIATTDHASALMLLRYMIGDTSIDYLSDDASGQGLNWSSLSPGIGGNAFTLTINGAPQVLAAAGTLNAGTVAIDPPANQRQTAHTTGIATFAPYVVSTLSGPATYAAYLQDTTTGGIAWIVSAATPATPSCSRPVTSAGVASALTIGHAATVFRGSLLTLANMPGAQVAPTLNAFAFTAASVGAPNSSYNQCSFAGSLAVGGTYVNCFAQDDVDAPGMSVGMVAGALVSDVGFAGTLTLSGDTYVTGARMIVGDGFLEVLVVDGGDLGSTTGAQFQDLVADPGALYIAGAVATVGGLLWGSGSSFLGVMIGVGGTLLVASGATPPIVTATLGEFGFQGPVGLNLVLVARTFDPATGDYTEAGGPATRATTWANWAAAIASGGLNFQAVCVEWGSAVRAQS